MSTRPIKTPPDVAKPETDASFAIQALGWYHPSSTAAFQQVINKGEAVGFIVRLKDPRLPSPNPWVLQRLPFQTIQNLRPFRAWAFKQGFLWHGSSRQLDSLRNRLAAEAPIYSAYLKELPSQRKVILFTPPASSILWKAIETAVALARQNKAIVDFQFNDVRLEITGAKSWPEVLAEYEEQHEIPW